MESGDVEVEQTRIEEVISRLMALEIERGLESEEGTLLKEELVGGGRQSVSALWSRFSDADPDDREVLLSLIKRIDDAGFNEVLMEHLRWERLDIVGRLSLADLLRSKGMPVAEGFYASWEEGRRLLDRLRGLFQGGEMDEGSAGESVSALKSLTKSVCRQVVQEIAREEGGKALPILNRLAMDEDMDYAQLVLDVLEASRSADFIDLLRELSASHRAKEVRKRGKKQLYKLKLSGVFEEGSGGVAEKPAVSKPEFRLTEGYAGVIGSEGDRPIWIVKTKPMGGIHLLYFFINDLLGVLECRAYSQNRKDYRLTKGELEKDERYVPLDPYYCVELVEEAAGRNKESGTELPRDYVLCMSIIGSERRADERPLIYGLIDPEAVRGDAQLLQESPDLMKLEILYPWSIPTERIEKYLFEYQEVKESRIVVSPALQNERYGDIYAKAAMEIFQGDYRRIFRRRLEETASYLMMRDMERWARIALAAALCLEERSGIEPKDHPLIMEIVRRSIEQLDRSGSGDILAPE